MSEEGHSPDSGQKASGSADFSGIKERFELLENRRQHQSAQIHKNMYLSLVITAGILGIFGNSESQVVLILASVIATATFGGLGVWTYLYARSREQAKSEKRKIFYEYSDSDYFQHTNSMHERGQNHWKLVILHSFYAIMTVGSFILVIFLLISF